MRVTREFLRQVIADQAGAYDFDAAMDKCREAGFDPMTKQQWDATIQSLQAGFAVQAVEAAFSPDRESKPCSTCGGGTVL